uniref:CHK domain-containing protein n=1 Tax=Glossina brevipalpis TaxID=37001 RepID=A0A1A9WZV1_9MUSC
MGATTLELSFRELQELCFNYLKDCIVFKEELTVVPTDFHILKYELNPIAEHPAGYLGLHQYLVVEFSNICKNNRNDETNKVLRFFTKSAPMEIPSRMAYLEEFGVFKKEILVYREILPHLEQIFGQVAPRCYYANKNLLIFEDLMHKGYRMGAKRDGVLDYGHLSCAIKSLAKMHAASLVYERKMKSKINGLHPDAVVENAYPLNVKTSHMRYQNFSNAVKVIEEILKLLPKYEKNLKDILHQLPEKMQKIFELSQTSSKYCNVLSHADLWANNIMFKYSLEGHKPIDCRFVDFQLARYAPPMVDLITLLTIPTSREFRKYYECMLQLTQRENLSLDQFLTQEQFYASLEEFRICGLIESLLFSHLTILPEESTRSLTSSADGFSDFFNRKRIDICLKAFHTDKVYQTRLCDMLEDLLPRELKLTTIVVIDEQTNKLTLNRFRIQVDNG